MSTAPEQLKAFVEFGANEDYDPYAGLFQSFVHQNGSFNVLNLCLYTQPVPNPSVLQQILSIQPQHGNDLRTATLSEMTDIPRLECAYDLRSVSLLSAGSTVTGHLAYFLYCI